MIETKHTPGPWIAVDRSAFRMNANDPKWEIDAAAGKQCFWIALTIREEDASLIAAAPQLLEACRAMRATMHSPDSIPSRLADAAIAKAEGRS